MIGNDTRKKHLEQLQQFIYQEEVHGWVANMWYHTLRTQYPYEFIVMARIFCKKFPDRKDKFSEWYIEEAIKIANRHYTRVHETLITGNDQLLETDEFKWSANTLQNLLKKQSREN
jgi:hypothetical protein